MFRHASKAWLFTGAGSLGMLVACNQLLGIEEASVDARLTAGNQSVTSGGTTGQAGSQTTGGSAGTESGAGTGGSGHDHTVPEAGASSEGGSDGGPGPSSGGTTAGSAGTSHQGHETNEAGGSGEGGSAGGDSEPADLCERYCNEMDAQCVGVAAQYRDRDQCLKVCRLFPEGDGQVEGGSEGEGQDGNSVTCRLKYAKKARYGLGAEVNAYCGQAGPSGDGRCGSVCESFCSLMDSVCTETTAGPYHFESSEVCLSTCQALPLAGVSYSSSDPLVADGNHALCRLFHVTSAAMADPEEHCEHALGITLCEAPLL